MDNFCQSPVTTNIQGKVENVQNERRISSDILAETMKGFKGLTLDSTINDSAYYHSEEGDAESDPKSNTRVATLTSDGKKRKDADTETTNGKSPQKLLINRLIPEITPDVIKPIDQTITKDAVGSGETLYVRRMILLKDIVTDASRRAAYLYRNPTDVSWQGKDRTTPQDGNTDIGSTRSDSLVRIGGSTTGSPTRTGIQDIISPRVSISHH